MKFCGGVLNGFLYATPETGGGCIEVQERGLCDGECTARKLSLFVCKNEQGECVRLVKAGHTWAAKFAQRDELCKKYYFVQLLNGRSPTFIEEIIKSEEGFHKF